MSAAIISLITDVCGVSDQPACGHKASHLSLAACSRVLASKLVLEDKDFLRGQVYICSVI